MRRLTSAAASSAGSTAGGSRACRDGPASSRTASASVRRDPSVRRSRRCSFLQMCSGSEGAVPEAVDAAEAEAGAGAGARFARHDRRERVLRPALAEAGEEGEHEQGEAPVVRVSRSRRPGAWSSPPSKANVIAIAKAPPISGRQAAEEERCTARRRRSRARTLPLLIRWITLTTAPRAPATRAATGAAQLMRQPDGGDRSDGEDHRRNAAEVDELRLSVRRLAVVGLDLLDLRRARGRAPLRCSPRRPAPRACRPG